MDSGIVCENCSKGLEYEEDELVKEITKELLDEKKRDFYSC